MGNKHFAVLHKLCAPKSMKMLAAGGKDCARVPTVIAFLLNGMHCCLNIWGKLWGRGSI